MRLSGVRFPEAAPPAHESSIHRATAPWIEDSSGSRSGVKSVFLTFLGPAGVDRDIDVAIGVKCCPLISSAVGCWQRIRVVDARQAQQALLEVAAVDVKPKAVVAG